MEDRFIRWLAPDAPPGAYNDWQWAFQFGWGPNAFWFTAGMLLLAWLVFAWGLRRVRGGGAILAVRSAALLVGFFLFMQPAIELRAVSSVRSKVAVLFDESRSMELASQDGTRLAAAQDHWTRNRRAVDALRDRAELEVYGFAAAARPAELDGLRPTGPSTHLAGVLADLKWQAESQDLGAVLIYSDGADTKGLTAEEAARRAADLGVPIHAVGFEAQDTAPDVAIARVQTDDFAFVHNSVKFDVEVEARGVSVASVPVTLKRKGSVVRNEQVPLVDGKGRVRFEFEPRQVGKDVYTVSTPVLPEEVVASNNAKSIVLRVIRDRIRVLQVAGRPSWDVRFLRELLERNPNVDLISFFILRSTTDVQKAPQEDLALIPFPVNDLFTTELDSFDVVIYQNFTYRPYRMAHYLRNIRQYVLDGGSFLMVGGDQSFEPGFYAGTPIADILPVRMLGEFGGRSFPWDEAAFRPRLTPEGLSHPITRVGPPGAPPETVYPRLPELKGANGSAGLMPDAKALWVHPSLPGNPPVVSIREVQQGRTMAVATDSTWYWRFRAVGDGRQGREYDRFWNQSLRWLIRDPDLARVRIDLDHSVVSKGEPVEAEVEVLGLDYGPLEGAQVELELVPLAGSGAEGSGQAREAETGASGKARVRFSDLAPGTYLLEARARTDEDPVGTASEPVIVEAADLELREPFPRPELLQALAEGSGGSFRTVREPMGPLPLKDARRVEVDRSRQVPIWDALPALLLLLALLGVEWGLRRRAGLI